MFRFSRAPDKPRFTYEDLTVGDRTVEITRRPYKRSLGVTLKMNGRICVSAPKGLSTEKIRDFVVEQEEWIRENLSKYESVRRAHPKKQLIEGELFPFLGGQFPLAFEPCTGKPCFKIENGKLVCGVRREVWHCFDPHKPHPELLLPLTQFYKKKAREILLKSIRQYSSVMNLHPTALRFGAQRTRWGSCSSRGRVSLNWKMLIAPLEVIDYVVIHELSHLRYYNHSKAFWSLVATQSPDYGVHREWLRLHQFEADFLATESELHPSERQQRVDEPSDIA